MKILKFGAIWCVECIVARPVWEDINEEITGLDIIEYDADNDTEAMDSYQVKDIPILIFLDKDGSEIERVKGISDKKKILNMIKEYQDK